MAWKRTPSLHLLGVHLSKYVLKVGDRARLVVGVEREALQCFIKLFRCARRVSAVPVSFSFNRCSLEARRANDTRRCKRCEGPNTAYCNQMQEMHCAQIFWYRGLTFTVTTACNTICASRSAACACCPAGCARLRGCLAPRDLIPRKDPPDRCDEQIETRDALIMYPARLPKSAERERSLCRPPARPTDGLADRGSLDAVDATPLNKDAAPRETNGAGQAVRLPARQ